MIGYAAYAIIQAVLAVVAIRLYRRRPSLGAFALILPTAAVVWDNAIIALGAWIGDGPLLVALSWPRFIGHALLTPIWIITGVAYARRAGVGWLDRPWVRAGQWVLYAVCVLFGVLRSVVFLRMVPVTDAGALYYANEGTFPGPPIGSIVMLCVVLACAFPVWRLARWPWMLVGSAFMLVAALVRLPALGSLLQNLGEVVMAASLVATEWYLQRRTPSEPNRPDTGVKVPL